MFSQKKAFLIFQEMETSKKFFILEKKEFCKDFAIKADNGTEKPVVLQRKIGKTGLLN